MPVSSCLSKAYRQVQTHMLSSEVLKCPLAVFTLNAGSVTGKSINRIEILVWEDAQNGTKSSE